MIQAFVAAFAICVLVLMSFRANRRFHQLKRLPMQWSLDGSVNWRAPRHITLAFTPILAAVILSTIVALSLVQTPRPGQEGYVVPVFFFVGLTFVGAHAFHLWLIGKSVRLGG
jgi:hypothetical protein